MSTHTGAPQVKPIDECRTVAELLATPDRWTQGAGAVDSDGNPVPPRSSRACRFCVVGAVGRVYGDGITNPVLNRFQEELAIENEIDWNDAPERTHEEVLAAVTRLGI